MYDLVRMMDGDVGKNALSDADLYATIIKHRFTYTRISGIDYTSHERETVSFIPPDLIIEAYKRDYETMRTVMIYGESPNFEDLIEKLNELTYRVRPTKNPPVVTIPVEMPNYKFYKNFKEWKAQTSRVDLGENFKSIMLHNIVVKPLEVKHLLTLEVLVENENTPARKYEFPLSLMEKGRAKDSETIFFRLNGKIRL
ncbi:MAG: hypothetical protein IPO32_17165 [Crocinitomicaceae bacterium]|nr:hypothetical protein [Crocinitomicaceae bacterium]